MKTFLFTTRPSRKRGMDIQVRAYRVKHNDPIYLGYQDLQYRSTKGAYAVACDIISKAGEANMDKDGYGLQAHSETRVIEL